jgi:hypothetical protein
MSTVAFSLDRWNEPFVHVEKRLLGVVADAPVNDSAARVDYVQQPKITFEPGPFERRTESATYLRRTWRLIRGDSTDSHRYGRRNPARLGSTSRDSHSHHALK